MTGMHLTNFSLGGILGFGNFAALDFQARCIASKTGKVAKYGSLIAGCLTLLVGLPFSFLGSLVRVFAAETCSEILQKPTCAEWVPDDLAFLRLATNQAPDLLGGWCLIGIVIVMATMSTADGAILAPGTVTENNLFRQFDTISTNFANSENLLLVARLSKLPLTLVATSIAAFNRSDEKDGASSTGTLLIVAFYVASATVVVPLFGAFYAKSPSPRAALVSIIGGAMSRLIMEFSLKKDGSFLLPFGDEEHLDYGPAVSNLPPLL